MAVIKSFAKKTPSVTQAPKRKELLAAIHSALFNRPADGSNSPAVRRKNKNPLPFQERVSEANGAPCSKGKAPLSLQAFTAAALMLPGLIQSPAYAADDDEVDFQYSHYQEGRRDIYGQSTNINGDTTSAVKLPSLLNPIEVDSLLGSSRISLTDRVKFAFNYIQDTWSGATPVGTAPVVSAANRARQNFIHSVVSASPYLKPDGAFFYTDGKGNFYSTNPATDPSSQKNNQLTHVLSFASPETRKQGDFKLAYQWDEAAVDVGGGISVENDYESRFGNLGGRWDFNQKQTSVNLGLSYTNSDTFATLDPDGLDFISTASYEKNYLPLEGSPAKIDSTFRSDGRTRSGAVLHGNRQDWGTQLGLSQILNKNALLELNMGYTRSTGYMANPYKAVYVLTNTAGQDLSKPYRATSRGLLETRPDERNQFNWNLGYNQYLEPFDAATHFDYRFAHDDWGINAHTFEADWVQPLGAGWSVTPRVRYYSQSSADFYYPYLTQEYDAGRSTTSDPLYSLPKAYSSDQRLSGFGALSGGVTVAKQFAKGVSLETGFEYYTHQGGLKLGGGEQAFADYDYWVANAALKVNLSALGNVGHSGGHSDPAHHHGNAPAGVMFAHTLDKSGDFMAGYRYMRNEQAGGMLHGSETVSPDTVNLNGCGNQECMATPTYMAMNMHMLDLMYAPTDRLSLMLMPQWMDMEMRMTHAESTNGMHHGNEVPNHQTGGVGDTGVYALFKLFDRPGHHLTLGLGGTAPTGDVDITLRRTYTNQRYDIPIHYGMQLGSGTWDFKPSLSYVGQMDEWSWGAQLNGTVRLQDKNKSGYALGNIFQSSVWGGYAVTDWLSASVRGVYTQQGTIRHQFKTHIEDKLDPIYGHVDYDANVNGISMDDTGEFDPGDVDVIDYKPITVDVAPPITGPMDMPGSYGGQYVDVGFGLSVNIPNGAFAGHSLSFEWLQPTYTNVNGYQLNRDGALAVNWNVDF